MFRFTIRELLLTTVVVALAVGWWMQNKKITSLQRDNSVHRVALTLTKANNEMLGRFLDEQCPSWRTQYSWSDETQPETPTAPGPP